MKFYPIGIQDFASIVNDGFVYVDKTALVYQLARVKGVYFLSRPRRFGKSLLVSTLKYYFQGRKDLFKGLKMESLEKDWKEYPVFEIDFSRGNFTKTDALGNTINGIIGAWEDVYGKNPHSTEYSDRFAYVLKKAHEKTGKRCVVLVDEYDKPLLDVMDSGLKVMDGCNEIMLEDMNRNILKSLFSTFKSADPDLRFVFLTGVTKFAQVSVFSGFNNARDISMNPNFETICGISQEELDTDFHDSIEELAEANNMTFEETSRQLKDTYDGYHFSKRMTDMYNPFSLLNTFANNDFSDYWFATGTPTYLLRLLAHKKEHLSQIVGKEYSPQQFVDYRATVEAPVPMIYQSGYLTIKSYDRETNRYMLDFPNKEVSNGFLLLEAANYFHDNDGNKTSSWAIEAALALKKGQIDKFHDMLVDFIASIPFNVRVDNSVKSYEKEFHIVVFLLIRLIGGHELNVQNEKPDSNGIADLVVETPNYVYIFEFKLDHPASQAIAQIEARGYAEPYAHDSRKVYLIGCSFSSETGRVSDWQVK